MNFSSPCRRSNDWSRKRLRRCGSVKQAATAKLPADRETLFYYNLREIPPVPENSEDHAVLQVAIQSRIKLFWRPAALRKKWEKMLNNSYRLASRITNLP